MEFTIFKCVNFGWRIFYSEEMQGGNERMKSVIEALWDGSLKPKEDALFDGEEFKDPFMQIFESNSELLASLSAEQKLLFEQMMERMEAYNRIEKTRVFECGFRLGAKMAMEMLAQ